MVDPCEAGEREHPEEQGGYGEEVRLPEGGESVVARVLVRREDPVEDFLVSRLSICSEEEGFRGRQS